MFKGIKMLALSVLTMGSLVAAGAGIAQQDAKVAEAESDHSKIIRIYFSSSWDNDSDYKCNGVTMKKTSTNPDEYISSYGNYVADLTPVTDLTSITGPQFRQWNWFDVIPDSETAKTYNSSTSGKINHSFKLGCQYTITNTGWLYDYNNQYKGYKYSITDHGEIDQKATVTLNANGGKFADGKTTISKEVKSVDDFEKPTNDDENLMFFGWYDDASGNTESTSIKDGNTYYAKWVPAKVVYFNPNGKWTNTTNIYVYTFRDTIPDGSLNPKEMMGGWPGTNITSSKVVENGKTLYSVKLPVSAANDGTIFNNGNGNGAQTNDLVIPNDYKNCYTITGAGVDKDGTKVYPGAWEKYSKNNFAVYAQSQVSGSNYNVRFWGTIDNEDVSEFSYVGFKFVAITEEGKRSSEVIISVDTVYSEVTYMGENGVERLTREKYETSYFYFYTITDVPVGTKFEVTPVAKIIDKDFVAQGVMKTFTVIAAGEVSVK